MESPGYGYLYKDVLPVSLLILIDDMIGVSNASFKAHQMNTVLNVKTADKRLQFGIKKCKSMLVSKNPENVLNSNLMVDEWDVKHVYNPDTDNYDICETN